MSKHLLFLLPLLLSVPCHGQNCSQRLVTAERDYEGGRLAHIPAFIAGCLKSRQGFSKEEKIRAYKLLTLVYIFTDDEPNAEEALTNLLNEDPEHILRESSDPAELFYLYSQFKTKPIFRLGIRGGVNSTFPRVSETFTTGNALEARKFYNGRGGSDEFTDLKGRAFPIGYWVEVTCEKHLLRGIELGIGLQARFTGYDLDNFFSNQGVFYQNSLTSTQFYARAPVFVRYTHGYNRRKGIKPYVFAGFGTDYLVSAGYTNADRSGGAQYTLPSGIQGSDLKAFDQVNELNFSLFGGIGLKIPAKTHFFTAELRYDNALLNYVKSANRGANQVILFDLGHMEDNLTIDVVSFSVGYIRSFYNPKKRKR